MLLIHNLTEKKSLDTWHAKAVICEGVSGEKAGRRAAPTYNQN